jgi:cell division septum initiation protein DivIVA
MFIKTSVSGGMAVRKVGINEKKLSLDYDPVSLMELSDFYKYLSELTEPIDVIPEQFGSLICRLVQDTDYELKVIAKKVLNLLVISSSHVPYLPQQVIENAIEKYLERVNYGISDDHKNLALYRWEVKNYETLHSAKSSINEDAINQLISKIAERRSFREDGMVHLQELVENMSEEERVALLSCEATPKATKTKEEREAEKERLKREKEIEKQRLKEEKEQERQRLKQEKEAEKLRLKNEKEAEKQKLKDEKRKSLASAKKETPKTVLDSKKKRQSQCTLKDFFLQNSTTKTRNVTVQF